MKVGKYVQLELDIACHLKVEVSDFAFLKKFVKLKFMNFQAS
jgi:hypothetical protein